MSKHTPIPWRIERNHPAQRVIHLAILAANGDMPCSVTPMTSLRPVDEANAEFIVRACNNHDKLVAALKQMLAEFETLTDSDPDWAWKAKDARTALANATKETP